MNVKLRHDFRPCVPGALSGGLTRTAFFDGMVLSEADMLREQSYWGMKRKLTNRALGRGVVWGLNMQWDAKRRCFTLCPGYGISCCGDDLVVECPEMVCEGDLIDPCSEEFRRLFVDNADPCRDCDSDPKAPIEACLYLEYVECPEDPRQVFEDPCAEAPQGCRYGAVRETTRLMLVPPPPPLPPGPIERFCEKMAEIKAELAAQGVAMPDAHVTSGVASAGIAMGGTDVNGVTISKEARFDLVTDAEGRVEASGIEAEIVTLRITPPPGYVITKVDDVSSMDTLMGLDLNRTASELAAGAPVVENVRVEFTPLLGIGHTVLADIELTAHLHLDGSDGSIDVLVRDAQKTAGRKDCLNYFADGIRLATGDTSCTLRTLALAEVTGWFKGMLGAPACCPEDAEEPDRAQLVLAWIIAWLAWQILWGIDIRDDRARGAMRCLQKLFEWWCDGMHYKGPRCECDAHGIYLGCVKVSPKGKIVCFDEWKHRRYVLTGPLLTHWGSQFGLAPLDVTATRLASWVCCIAGTEMPAVEEEALASADARVDLAGTSFARYGQAQADGTVHGAAISGTTRDVGFLDFVGEVLDRFQRNAQVQPADPQAYSVVTSQELGLELATPLRADGRAELRRERSIAEEALQARVAEVPPMARKPTVDFVDALADKVTLAELKASERTKSVAPMVNALESAEISSIAELIELGPEGAIAKARAEIAATPELSEHGAAEAAMNQIYTAALATVEVAGKALAEDAAERPDDDPFLRGNLEDAGTLADVRVKINKTLRGRGLSAATLRDIAAEAVAKRR